MTTHTTIAAQVAELIAGLPAVQDGLVDIRACWDDARQAWRVSASTPAFDRDGQAAARPEWRLAGWAADGTPEEILQGVCRAARPGAAMVGRWQGEDGIIYESVTIDSDDDEDVYVGFYRHRDAPGALITCAATDSGWEGSLDWYAPGDEAATIEAVEDPDRCGSMAALILELAADADE